MHSGSDKMHKKKPPGWQLLGLHGPVHHLTKKSGTTRLTPNWVLAFTWNEEKTR